MPDESLQDPFTKARSDNQKCNRICITIDSEFWDSLQFFGVEKTKSTRYGNKGCLALLRLFKSFNIKTTFFVSVEFAQQYPESVRRIVEGGHEIASHSFSHVRFSRLRQTERLFEIAESKKFLETKFHIPVKGFRAPGNLISSDHFKMLKEAGYKYDSSVHAALLPGQFFNVFRPKSIFGSEGIVEIPISTLGIFPISWVWFRNSGSWLAKLGVQYNQLFRRPVVFYLHSWEFESLPSARGLPRYITRKTGIEFLNMVAEFIDYLRERGFSFNLMDELADEYLDHHSSL